jgi:hypothetical protein
MTQHSLTLWVPVFALAFTAALPARAEPIVELGVGVGAGEHTSVSESLGTRDFSGLAGMFEITLANERGHGGGLRLGGISEFKLFGGTTRGSFLLDGFYLYHFTEPGRPGWHVVPTLAAGPSLARVSAKYEPSCFLGCSNDPPESLHDYDHLGLGASAGGAFDVHYGRSFVGADARGRFVFPVDNSDIGSGQTRV